jgi:hypothetical protein
MNVQGVSIAGHKIVTLLLVTVTHAQRRVYAKTPENPPHCHVSLILFAKNARPYVAPVGNTLYKERENNLHLVANGKSYM